MFAVFKATLSPMLVMFLCIVIGFILHKKSLLPENGATVLSKLENYVLVPSLIINTFMKYCTVASLKQQYRMILYCFGAIVVAVILSTLMAGFFEKDEYKKNIYRYALTFGNFGFMSNAIVPAILGEEVLYTYLLFSMPLYLVCYTWGVAILIPQGETRKNPLYNLLNPIVISLGVGIILGLLGVEKYLPSFVTTTLQNLSACMGPLAMVLTGFVIGNYKFTSLLKDTKIYIATVLRLIVLPAFFIALLYICGADKLTLQLAFFGFATPLGLNTVIFPAAYGSDSSTGASMAMISHTLCVITIPVMYALMMSII